VEPFGDNSLADTDSILIDRKGAFSGTPGTLFTASGYPINGAIYEIGTNGHVTTFKQSSSMNNPDVSGFDNAGRLIVTCYGSGLVFAVQSNGVLTQLISDFTIALTGVDSLSRLVCSSKTSNYLRLYTSAGQLLNSQVAPSRPNGFVSTGLGGFWGTDVYTSTSTGDLLRIDTNGVTRVFGTGFGAGLKPAFGWDGNMYVCDQEGSRIWRISPLQVNIRLSAVDICWNSQSNKNYQVEYKSELTTNQWTALDAPIPGNDATSCITDAIIPGQPQRYYRVGELP
jgi:hypothetical protein